jgi:hypothetical protein
METSPLKTFRVTHDTLVPAGKRVWARLVKLGARGRVDMSSGVAPSVVSWKYGAPGRPEGLKSVVLGVTKGEGLDFMILVAIVMAMLASISVRNSQTP